MKSRFGFVCAVLVSFIFMWSIDCRAEAFGDFYFETVYLDHSNTVSGLGHVRVGRRLDVHHSTEVYGVARLGEDIRTQMDEKTQRLSNPLVFGGVGIDEVFADWGVRLTAQAGASYQKNDLDRLNGTQFDFRGGALGYWEKQGEWLRYESYAEALYLHRLRSIFVTPQFRLYSPLLNFPIAQQPVSVGPLVMLVPSASWDFNPSSPDFSGWTEFRAGVRAEKRTSSFLLQLNPFYVFGRHFERSPYRDLTYQEFRFLLAGYFSW